MAIRAVISDFTKWNAKTVQLIYYKQYIEHKYKYDRVQTTKRTKDNLSQTKVVAIMTTWGK